MTSVRFDLRHLRLLLTIVAVALSLIAVPNGASAEQNNGGGGTKTKGQTNCEAGGGTWTIDGTKATCKGRTDGQSWSCDLVVAPNGTACSHLPGSGRPARRPGGAYKNVSVVVSSVDAGVARDPEPTPAPTRVAYEASDAVFSMSPLDE